MKTNAHESQGEESRMSELAAIVSETVSTYEEQGRQRKKYIVLWRIN